MLRFISSRLIRTSTTSELWAMRTESPFPLPLTRTPQSTSLHLRASSPSTQLHYQSFSGQWRLGKLLEDLDALAGTVAYRHCDDGVLATEPPTIVTACVDRVVVAAPLFMRSIPEITLNGYVKHTTQSTMQVVGEVLDVSNGDVVVSSLFVMAARESGSAWRKVPALETATGSLLSERKVPTRECFETRFEMDSVWVTEPQDKNLAGNVFGGVLIRKAVELAQAAAMVHLGGPRFGAVTAIEQINFLRPVPVGSVVRFSAKLGKESGHENWQVLVETEVVELNSRERFHSHTFHILL
jgi:acyl-coenzyme A thioesterase 9